MLSAWEIDQDVPQPGHSRKGQAFFKDAALGIYTLSSYCCSKENTIQVQIERHFIKYLTNIFQMC